MGFSSIGWVFEKTKDESAEKGRRGLVAAHDENCGVSGYFIDCHSSLVVVTKKITAGVSYL